MQKFVSEIHIAKNQKWRSIEGGMVRGGVACEGERSEVAMKKSSLTPSGIWPPVYFFVGIFRSDIWATVCSSAPHPPDSLSWSLLSHSTQTHAIAHKHFCVHLNTHARTHLRTSTLTNARTHEHTSTHTHTLSLSLSLCPSLSHTLNTPTHRD